MAGAAPRGAVRWPARGPHLPPPVGRGFVASRQRNRCWEVPPGSTFRSSSSDSGSVPPPGDCRSLLPQVDEGGRAPLSFHHFFAADDQDGLRSDAVITLSALPRYGCIENAGTGRPWPGGPVAPDLVTRRGRLPPVQAGRGG